MNAISLPSKPPPVQGLNVKASASKQSTPPNQTLFITNLDNNLNKDDLRRGLYMLFSTHGPVLDVVALKRGKSRGTAHVVFRDINTSSQAMRSLQGFEFFGKELRISFAKGRSDVISRLSGTARQPEPPKGQAPTDLQKSIFAMPPGAAPPTAPAPAPGTTALPATLEAPPNGMVPDGAKSPQGVKRPREEEPEEAEDEAMEESSGGEEMDVSDEDD